MILQKVRLILFATKLDIYVYRQLRSKAVVSYFECQSDILIDLYPRFSSNDQKRRVQTQACCYDSSLISASIFFAFSWADEDAVSKPLLNILMYAIVFCLASNRR